MVHSACISCSLSILIPAKSVFIALFMYSRLHLFCGSFSKKSEEPISNVIQFVKDFPQSMFSSVAGLMVTIVVLFIAIVIILVVPYNGKF